MLKIEKADFFAFATRILIPATAWPAAFSSAYALFLFHCVRLQVHGERDPKGGWPCRDDLCDRSAFRMVTVVSFFRSFLDKQKRTWSEAPKERYIYSFVFGLNTSWLFHMTDDGKTIPQCSLKNIFHKQKIQLTVFF